MLGGGGGSGRGMNLTISNQTTIVNNTFSMNTDRDSFNGSGNPASQGGEQIDVSA
jgi:hypothetical protein